VRDFQFVDDGASDHIARRQVAERVVFRHEAVHLHIAEMRTFAAQRLRD